MEKEKKLKWNIKRPAREVNTQIVKANSDRIVKGGTRENSQTSKAKTTTEREGWTNSEKEGEA